MRMLALALALFVSCGCRSAAPKPPSSVPQPPAPSAEYQSQLPFLEPPPLGLPDMAAWTGAQAEGIIIDRDVPRLLAAGEPVTVWLVRRGICGPSAPQCMFLAHTQILQEHFYAEATDNRILVRYAFRSATGVIAEGCLLLTRKDGTVTYVFWSRRDTFWIYHDDADKQKAELLFVHHLNHLVGRLVAEDQLEAF